MLTQSKSHSLFLQSKSNEVSTLCSQCNCKNGFSVLCNSLFYSLSTSIFENHVFLFLVVFLITQRTNEIEEGLQQPHNIHIIAGNLSSSLRQLASPLFVCTTMENKVQINSLEHVKSAWISPSMLVTSKCFL